MTSVLRRVTIVTIALMMVFTFLPQLGGYRSFAGGGFDLSGILKGGDPSGNVTAGDAV